MNFKFLGDPYLVYVGSFSLVVILYHFDWSYLYPQLPFAVYLLLIGSFACAAIFRGRVKYDIVTSDDGDLDAVKVHLHFFILAVLIAANILYVGGVPLFQSFYLTEYRAKEVDLMPMGFPLLVGYAHYIGVRLYMRFLELKKNYIFLQSMLLAIPPLLFVQRGLAFSQISTYIILHLYQTKSISVKKIIVFLIVAFLLILGFSELGFIRDSGGRYYRSITDMGEANENFYALYLPEAVFYIWLYLTSPLANLATNMITNVTQYQISLISFYDFLASEILLDVVSKRLFDLDQIELNYHDFRIIETLNVGTIYTRSYSYLGPAGVILIMVYLFSLAKIYQFMIKKLGGHSIRNIYIGNAMLSNLMLMEVFDNMLSNSARMFPLVLNLCFIFYANKNLRAHQ